MSGFPLGLASYPAGLSKATPPATGLFHSCLMLSPRTAEQPIVVPLTVAMHRR
jgi:hypothetical protein